MGVELGRVELGTNYKKNHSSPAGRAERLELLLEEGGPCLLVHLEAAQVLLDGALQCLLLGLLECVRRTSAITLEALRHRMALTNV